MNREPPVTVIKNDCGCIVTQDRHGSILTYCPLHGSAPELYEALLAVYKDIELQNVEGGSDELNTMVSKALAEV